MTAGDSFYCLGLRDRLGPLNAIRVGLFHYTTAGEVDATLDALAAASG